MSKPLLVFFLLLPTLALAQEDSDDAPPGATQAIQERSYRMAFELGLGGSILPLDPFTKTVAAQASATFHFTDSIAWQIARFGYGYNWATGLRQQLERDFDVKPKDFTTVQFYVGSDLMFTPFYGKSAVANKWVIHYEAYILVGGSVFKFSDTFRPGIDVGGGLRIFQNKYLSYRVEVIDSIVIGGNVGNELAATIQLCLNIGSTE